MAVPNISEVPGLRWITWNSKTHDHTCRKRWQCDTGLVHRLGRDERDAQAEPGGDRVGVSDGTRVEHGACDVHGAGSGGGDGV